jgi:hypothetical protein
MRNYRINLEKNIGSSIFIVEGAVSEFNIAETVFVKNLGYELIRKARNETLFRYQNPNNPYSRVAVLNCAKNQLHTLDFDEIDSLCTELINEYDFDLANSAFFYLYDRDVYSYTDGKQNVPRQYLKVLTSARPEYKTVTTSGYDGLLLLSYPCIEAFVTSGFDDYAHQYFHAKGNGDLKPFNDSHKYFQNTMDSASLSRAMLQMDKALEMLGIEAYDFSDFATTNLQIYDQQEQIYSQIKKFRLLSLFCIALLELGIIEEEMEIDLSEPRRK